ncbi:mandelate racemase/muconate lactonizing enzyme family protein [Bradyrhizobium diazoefficiens]|nr:mandelate racemase/muconate lactonizing enzyme family protein [Bradyrhizobium diazoefficiens]MBR0775500.1 mandelate racemase/muconate lactonizing enzyme family protein [Bradyrhizobium diazoefficiens]
MEITDVRAHHIRIPYDAGVASFRQGAAAISALDMVLVEVTTDAGLTGWGDAFAYVCPRTTRSAVEEMIAPQARGLKVPDAAGIPAVMEQIQRNLHLFGRYGITMFAISGLDIALWDLAAKIQGVPLHRLLGETRRSSIPAYASLLRIGSPEKIAGECRKALALSYGAIKLHETTTPAVLAAREAIGPGIPLMVDMNCPLSGEQAIAFAKACTDAQPMFLEEPVWPPEDFVTLAEVRSKGGLGVAAGENACTEYQFRQMMDAGAVSHAQPSVTKVGGITEFLKVARLADQRGVKIVPHSPYFGPGLLATLHLLAGRDDGLVEMFYLRREACLWGGRADVDASGRVAVPTGPGLGYEPDRGVMERYGAT